MYKFLAHRKGFEPSLSWVKTKSPSRLDDRCKKFSQISLGFIITYNLVTIWLGSRCRTRTYNFSINSRTFYHWINLEYVSTIPQLETTYTVYSHSFTWNLVEAVRLELTTSSLSGMRSIPAELRFEDWVHRQDLHLLFQLHNELWVFVILLLCIFGRPPGTWTPFCGLKARYITINVCSPWRYLLSNIPHLLLSCTDSKTIFLFGIEGQDRTDKYQTSQNDCFTLSYFYIFLCGSSRNRTEPHAVDSGTAYPDAHRPKHFLVLAVGFEPTISWLRVRGINPVLLDQQIIMVGPPGLEPGTNRLWGDCSDQLSYSPI